MTQAAEKPETEQELREALANLTRAHDAVLAHNRALTERLQDSRETNIMLREQLRRASSADIDDLVDTRRCIKAGRIDDGLYALEKVLANHDSSWRTRL